MMRRSILSLLLVFFISPLAAVVALGSSFATRRLFENARPELLNLLNHPLQLQLVTGDLALGAFQRLLLDRQAILQGLDVATEGMLHDELALYTSETREQWLSTAQQAGKTIEIPGMQCYTCGGNHLNLDCPVDQETSSSAQALKSLLESNGLEGATAVLQGYGFACSTLLKACESQDINLNPAYHDWIKTHGEEWTALGQECGAKLSSSSSSPTTAINSEGYTVCLSMLYNWIDAEAATTGIRADLNDPTLSAIMQELERLEPGYAAQRDKNQSFVADLVGRKTTQERNQKAQTKVDKAAAYLAAKEKKNAKLDAAAAYLDAKKKKELGQE